MPSSALIRKCLTVRVLFGVAMGCWLTAFHVPGARAQGGPTASLTANGVHNFTVPVGTTINYVWASTNATSATSSYTVDGGGSHAWDANSLSGSVSGTVAASQAGYTYVITYTVTNASGQSASDQVTIAVTSAPSPTASLTANGTHNLTVPAGATINYVWASTHGASATSSYTVDGVGPHPWDANSLSGSVSGTVTASQVGNAYVITYTVTNASGQSASDQVTIAVTGASSPTASLTANGMHSLTMPAGTMINYLWTSTNGASATSSYTVNGGGSQPWDANSLSGSVSGIVAASQVGNTYVITYTVRSANGQTASDQVTIAVSGSSTATHFSIVAPSAAVTGTQLLFTVNALDDSNNFVSRYSGTVHFSSSDAKAQLPGNAVITNGIGTFSATLNSPGNQTISVTDTAANSITGTSNMIDVTGPTAFFSVTSPTTAASGMPLSFTVSAFDAATNLTTGYSGTVHFMSSDPKAMLPANARLMFGTGTFSVTLNTLGTQTITATDTVSPSISGKSNPISVVSDTATHFSLSSSSNVRIGASFPITVTALDATNNVTPGYVATVHFTSSDPKAVLPADSMLTSGMGTFAVTLNTNGTQTITATDKITPSITGSESIAVFPTGCAVRGQECGASFLPPCCPGLICAAGGDRFFCYSAALETLPKALRFTTTCTLETPRELHTATLLNIGVVLITGGDNGEASLTTAELFNPDTDTFAPVGSMTSARSQHTATLLTDGTVLVTGGRNADGHVLATAEIFNPATMSFASAGSMSSARESHAATLLRNGEVLITGGDDGKTALATAELFDPKTGSFTSVAGMSWARSYQTVTLLQDGRVLVTGGQDASGNVLANAELFDPGMGRFTIAGSMESRREFHAATLLADGRVLVTGGEDGGGTLASAELFDPSSGKFTAAGRMSEARKMHTATLRNDGTVLVAGGESSTPEGDNGVSKRLLFESASAELFDPSSSSFVYTNSMTTRRAKHTATLLPGGEVLVVGGTLAETSPARSDSPVSAELFQ